MKKLLKMNNFLILSAAIVFAASKTLFHSMSQAQVPASMPAPSADSAFPIKGPLKWKSSGALVKPISDETHKIVSVKDPTVVYYNDAWHIYATTANTSGGWNMVYVSFKDWKDATDAKPYYMDQNPNLKGYHCAPQVFYFTPQKKWYLIYQSGPPQYSTADDLDKPQTWTKPQNLLVHPNLPGKTGAGLDFWIICDDQYAYLFSSGDDGRVYRSRTKKEDFPNGMSDPEIAISGPRNDVFEGGMIYKVKGSNSYLLLEEAIGPSRYYRAWTSNSLDGQWTPMPHASSFQEPFAGINNETFEDGVTAWSRDVSHGEMIRDGYDEVPTIDPNHLQLLYQGHDPSINPRNYSQLPYQLGLLTADNPKP